MGRATCLRPLLVFALLAPVAALSQSSEQLPSLLGVAFWSRPAYDGSSSQVKEAVPIISYEGHPWFARTLQGILEGGLRKEIAPKLNLAAQLAYESGRKQSESGFLRSQDAGDIRPGASIGGHVEWNPTLGPAPVYLVTRVRQALDTDNGVQADLRLTVGVFEKLGFAAAAYGQATWADAKSVRTFYGAPGFDPGGGLLYTSLGLYFFYDLSRDWVVMASAEEHRLHGDATNSPLTERHSNFYLFAGPAYKF